MRFVKFMKEDVTDALEVDEPKVGKKYSDDYVSKRIDIIQAAIKKVRGQKMNDDAKEAVMADLNDKLDKWENVDKETKAPKPVPTAGPEAPPETIPQEVDIESQPLEKKKEDTEDMKQELIDKKNDQMDRDFKEKDIERQKKDKDIIKKDVEKKKEVEKKAAAEKRLIKTKIKKI